MTEPTDERTPGAEAAGGAVAEARSPRRNDIADAVAARLSVQEGQTNATDSAEEQRAKLRSAQKLKVRRIVNDVSGGVSYAKAFACLKLIHTLLDNIITHPDEEKFRSFRASQPKIARDVLSIPRAADMLIEAGFRTRTLNFQQEWFVPDANAWATDSIGMLRLAWTRDTIGERMAEYEDHADRARSQAQQEKYTETGRKARALAEAQEDRERVALRTQRERAARLAAAAAEAERAKEPVEEEEMA